MAGAAPWDGLDDSSSFTGTIDSTSTTSTVPGPGAITGKFLKALGEITLDFIIRIIIRYRLGWIERVLEKNPRLLRNPVGEELPKLIGIYNDLHELCRKSRGDYYPQSIQRAAAKLVYNTTLATRPTSASPTNEKWEALLAHVLRREDLSEHIQHSGITTTTDRREALTGSPNRGISNSSGLQLEDPSPSVQSHSHTRRVSVKYSQEGTGHCTGPLSPSVSCVMRIPSMNDLRKHHVPPMPPESHHPTSTPTNYRSTFSQSRNSKYTPPTTPSVSSDSRVSRLPHLYLNHGHSSVHKVQFPRPDNGQDIEVLFEQVESLLGIHDSSKISIDRKAQIIHQDEQARLRNELKKQSEIKRQNATGQPVASPPSKGSPEWYLEKFMDMTITPKHVQSLAVSLRTLPTAWVKQFLSLQGVSILAQVLSTINCKGGARNENDIQLELEILRCIKNIHNRPLAKDAFTQPQIITKIACSLSSPSLQARKLAVEILIYICYFNEGLCIGDILAGLDALSHANGEMGTYDYWFKTLYSTLGGGRAVGSSVGASKEVRRAGAVDTSLKDYARSNTILIVGLVSECDKFDMRIHNRSQMEAAGVRNLFDRFAEFDSTFTSWQLKNWEILAAEDHGRLPEKPSQEVLKNFVNILAGLVGAVHKKMGKKGANGVIPEDEETEDDDESGEEGDQDETQTRRMTKKGRLKSGRQPDRASHFAGAEVSQVQKHVKHSLTGGAELAYLHATGASARGALKAQGGHIHDLHPAKMVNRNLASSTTSNGKLAVLHQSTVLPLRIQKFSVDRFAQAMLS